MTHRLATNYAKNYCNRTLIVKVIVENVVTCFLGTQCSNLGSTHIGGHDLTFRGHSRDVIGHMTIRFSIGHFLLVVLWNQASASNGFRDIQR